MPIKSTIDNFITNLQANGLTAKTGIIGRFCAVRYYHESVCYYDVLIRHDQNVTEKDGFILIRSSAQ